MKAYEITGAMFDTLDIFLESEQGETDRDMYEEVMQYLKQELQNKGTNIIKYVRNLELEAVSAKLEIERLEALKKSKESKAKSLKNYLKNILVSLDKKKIETELGNYTLRKSSKVEILDMSKIPAEYIRVKEERTPDKTLIGQRWKLGEIIEGTAVVEDYSLQIR